MQLFFKFEPFFKKNFVTYQHIRITDMALYKRNNSKRKNKKWIKTKQ